MDIFIGNNTAKKKVVIQTEKGKNRAIFMVKILSISVSPSPKSFSGAFYDFCSINLVYVH